MVKTATRGPMDADGRSVRAVLEELVATGGPDERSDEAVVGAVTAEAADHDLDAGVLTDEELAVVTEREREKRLPVEEFPVLGAMDRADRDVAVRVATRSLVARGLIRYDEDVGDYAAGLGALSLIAAFRGLAEAVGVVLVDEREKASLSARLYRVHRELFLCEEVSPDGVHAFALRSRASQARWLAAAVDPRGRAGQLGEVRTAAKPDRLEPSPDALLDGAETSAVVSLSEPISGSPGEGGWFSRGDMASRGFTAYGRPDGLWMAHAGSRSRRVPASVQALDADTLLAACAELLAPFDPDAGQPRSPAS